MTFAVRPTPPAANAARTSTPGSGALRPARGSGIPDAQGQNSNGVPNVRIDRIEIEVCGAISPAHFREGFYDAWLKGKLPTTQWRATSNEAFRAPLDLQITPGLSGREAGRRLAQAILMRAGQSGHAT